MMADPDSQAGITAVVVSHNGSDRIGACLASLAAQTLSRRCFEVMVIDNASTDGTAEAAARTAAERLAGVRFRILQELDIGEAHARNRALWAAQTPIVAYLDDDARADPRWLAVLLETFATDARLACVGGLIRNAPPPAGFPAWIRAEHLRALSDLTALGSAPIDCVDLATMPFGANIAFHRDALQALGGFNPTLGRRPGLGISGTEVEACFRLIQAGRRVRYQPAAIVEHCIAPDRYQPRYLAHMAFWFGATCRLWRRLEGHRDLGIQQGPRRARATARRALGIWLAAAFQLPRRRHFDARLEARLQLAERLGELWYWTLGRERYREVPEATPDPRAVESAEPDRLPWLSVVTPTCDRPVLLARMVRSLQEQVPRPNGVELIVVDDGSRTPAAEALARWLGGEDAGGLVVRLVRQARQGPSSARNRGVREAKADWILFIDDDCIAPSDLLLRCRRRVGDEAVAGIGGLLRPWERHTIGQFLDRRRAYELASWEGRVVYLNTAIALFRRAALLAIGGFDEGYRVPGGEDPELCVRLRQAGHRIELDPALLVYHRDRGELGALLRTHFQYGVGTRRLAERTGVYRRRHPWRAVLLHVVSLRGPWYFRRFCRRQGCSMSLGLLFMALDYLRRLANSLGYALGQRMHRVS